MENVSYLDGARQKAISDANLGIYDQCFGSGDSVYCKVYQAYHAARKQDIKEEEEG